MYDEGDSCGSGTHAIWAAGESAEDSLIDGKCRSHKPVGLAPRTEH